MGRRIVFAIFALCAVATVASTVDATGDALRDPSLHAWLVDGYWVLKLGVVSAFTYFVAVREPARRPSRDPVAFAACAAAILSAVALRPPAQGDPTALLLAGEVVALTGGAWLLASVLALGRCFGVLPEARGLVTRGPYRIVRHPVYLGELAALLGLVLGALSAWNLCCLALACAAQWVRMGLEERALTSEFPEYSAYAGRTPRLIPRPSRPSPLPAPSGS
jgi:protein-S-isoprenylcysteine O-methyltransferase Ste14